MCGSVAVFSFGLTLLAVLNWMCPFSDWHRLSWTLSVSECFFSCLRYKLCFSQGSTSWCASAILWSEEFNNQCYFEKKKKKTALQNVHVVTADLWSFPAPRAKCKPSSFRHVTRWLKAIHYPWRPSREASTPQYFTTCLLHSVHVGYELYFLY